MTRLEHLDTRSLLKRSGQRAAAQFHRVAAAVPFYRRLLSKRRFDATRVTSLETFQALVPIIEKRDVFTSSPLADLLVDRAFDDITTLISSSGVTAQSFSLGMLNAKGTRSMVRSTDRLLDSWFNVRRRKTLVISTFAMGVKVPTSLPCIDLSVRSDKAITTLQRLRPYFQQFIVISDVFFLKKLLEDGVAAGIDWKQQPVHFAMGGEWFPESYRRYLADVLQLDLYDRHPSQHIFSSMGATELGFNICYETHDTVRLRHLAGSDQQLCEALFGCVDTVPMIGHYDPRRWFIELTPTHDLDGGGSFVFTNVDLHAAMPLVRYKTGDYGYLLPHDHVRRVLRDFNYQEYILRDPLPLIAVAGRINHSIKIPGKAVRMEFLRSVLYTDSTLARQITGQFHAVSEGDRLHVAIQMQSHAKDLAKYQARFSRLINQSIPADVRLVPYFEFRHGMGVDYERKFSHMG